MTGLASHLWESTICAAVAGLLTLALRRNGARVRYSIWLAASLKFLLPFAALVALGAQFRVLAPARVPLLDVAFIVQTVTAPIAQAGLSIDRSAAQAPRAHRSEGRMLAAASVVWGGGSLLILATWWRRWRRASAVLRGAVHVSEGRVLDVLRRLELSAGHTKSLPLVSSDESLEPGIFGLLRPVLFWPHGLEEQLSDAQIEAILAHELVHVRHFDNLAAAGHMLVQIVFWFHPLVWWVGKRLLHERERACDETVLKDSDRQVYAESILKTCRFSLPSPMMCIAGVTGSSLAKRIESIMRDPAGMKLGVPKKMILGSAAIAIVVGPLGAGLLDTPRLRAQIRPVTDEAPSLEVASIKPNKPGAMGGHSNFQPLNGVEPIHRTRNGV